MAANNNNLINLANVAAGEQEDMSKAIVVYGPITRSESERIVEGGKSVNIQSSGEKENVKDNMQTEDVIIGKNSDSLHVETDELIASVVKDVMNVNEAVDDIIGSVDKEVGESIVDGSELQVNKVINEGSGHSDTIVNQEVVMDGASPADTETVMAANDLAKELEEEFTKEGDVQSKKDADSLILEALKEAESKRKGKLVQGQSGDDDLQIVDAPVSDATKTPKTRRTKSVGKRVQPARSCLSKKRKDKEIVVDEGDEESIVVKKQRITKREVLEDMECTVELLKDQRLDEVLDLLVFQGWDGMLDMDEMASPSAVIEFYNSLSVPKAKGNVLYMDFMIGGVEYTISSREISKILSIPHNGFEEWSKGVWPSNEEDRFTVQQRVCGTAEQGKVLSKCMSAKVKILHKILVTNLLPRGSKTSVVQLDDVLIIDKILRKEQINLPKLIILQMNYLSDLKQVGYARIVKKILKYHECYEFKDEVSVVRKFSPSDFKKMGLMFTDEEGWVKDLEKMEGKAADEGDCEGSNDYLKVRFNEVDINLGLVKLEVKKLSSDLKELKNKLTSDLTDMKNEFAGLKELVLQVMEQMTKT